MPETTPGSWQPDPFGRFAQRYWDGAAWTENVIDSAGAQGTDPPVASGSPPAQPRASSSAAPVPGLVVAGVGAVLLLLSLFVLNWFDFNSATKDSLRASGSAVERELGVSAESLVDGVKFSEVRTIADKAGTENLSTGVDQYLAWGYLASLVAVAFVAVALLRPTMRWPALGVAVLFAGWHAYAVNDLSESNIDTQLGAWLGTIGLVIAAIALLLPRPQSAPAH